MHIDIEYRSVKVHSTTTTTTTPLKKKKVNIQTKFLIVTSPKVSYKIYILVLLYIKNLWKLTLLVK